MRRILLASVLTACAAVPASTATASNVPPIPPINCGIVSCTYPIERAIDEATAGTEGIRECVSNTVGAVRNIIQGTPQPALCNP